MLCTSPSVCLTRVVITVMHSSLLVTASIFYIATFRSIRCNCIHFYYNKVSMPGYLPYNCIAKQIMKSIYIHGI